MRLKIGILCVLIALACIGCSCGKKGEESPSHTESSSVLESVGSFGTESDSLEESESGTESDSPEESESGTESDSPEESESETESTGESEDESGVEEGPSADDNELPIITDPNLG